MPLTSKVAFHTLIEMRDGTADEARKAIGSRA